MRRERDGREERRGGSHGDRGRRRSAGRASTDKVILFVGVAALLAVVVWVGPFRTVDETGYAHRDIETRRIFEIGRCVERFRARESRLPADLAELRAFVPDGPAAWALESGDVWGSPYVYVALGVDRYELRSLGADGVPGGEDDDADVVWTPAGVPAPGR